MLLPTHLWAAHTVVSPSGNYAFGFDQQEGKMLYEVSFKGQKVTHGELGLEIDNHLVELAMGIPTDAAKVWTSDMRLTDVSTRSNHRTWKPLYGECREIRDSYNEMILHFSKGNQEMALQKGYNKSKAYLLDIVVRAYDEGVALRYHFPEATNGLFLHVTNELTTFAFPEGTKAYHAAWAQGPYNEVALKNWKDESERPLLLKQPNGLYTAILEANLKDYVRGKLRLKSNHVLQISMYDSADMITPYDTPWRVIMAGEKAVDLINNKQIVLNLNDEPKGDFSWVKPGKVFRCTKLEKQWIFKSIDFAREFGIEYVELDAGWYGPEMKVESDAYEAARTRDFTLKEVCDYAREQGVGIWLYVNQRALYGHLDRILPRYAELGVKGVKFGFVQVGSQKWTTWLHKAVEACAKNKLMVDIHDEYRPTGVSRTYPNLMTQEGIRGNEEMPEADHNVILPFTRFLAGPADYTLCYFNSRVKNTKAHQLAMAAVYYSPITFLFWYDLPTAYQGEQELDFWKHIPTVWDESKALDGAPGEFIVQARRSGNRWFIGAINGKKARDMSIDTKQFLPKGKYIATIYNDDPTLKTRTQVSTTTKTIKSGDKLPLHLQPSGGAAIEIVPFVK